MGKYYSSSEETWNKETTAQEKIADGISKLYQINNALDRGFDELKSDKYGLMSNNSYDNFSYQIVQCGEKNHALSQYSKEIHGILKDKEISFCKGISKVIEEMSLLEITEYTTENTLGITERKNIPTAYYNGSMAYQAGMPISYQVKDVPKGKINILDIQMKTDIMGIEEQLEAYLKEEKGNLTDAELVELKEEYYQQYLQTSFEHEVYTDGWLKNLSTTLDYIPIVGGVKNAIEGLCGYTMTGEKLTTQERISYTALGILTTAVDVFTLGTASGLIQGGKFVGKELAKSGIKKLGKYAIMDSVSSVTMGWGSQFAGEKLKDFGLSAEGIFAIHLIAGIATAKMGKYKANKDLKKLASEVGLDVDQLNDVLKYTGMSGDELEKALKSTSLENILGISDKNLEYLKKQTNLSTDTILNELKKQGLNIEDVNPSNVDDVVKKLDEGVSGAKTPEQIIKSRIKGLDLNPHPIKQKQISSKKRTELKKKIDDRTITKAEYEQYMWNKRFSKRRASGVDDFWCQERQRILNNETLTRDWSQGQIDDILNGKKPKVDGKTVEGHHSYSASQYPQLANKGEVIYPVTRNEHLYGWHGGNFKNSIPGKPIKDISDF